MTKEARSQHLMRVQILDDRGEADGLPKTVQGRDAWALNHLIEAGKSGCTAIETPGPRWSHYVWKLRGYGFSIETIPEEHGGPFPGRHARYRLHSRLMVIGSERVAA